MPWLSATIVDFLFASLAILGIGPLFDKPGTKRILRYLGIIILIYFGFGIIPDEIGINIIPGLGISSAATPSTAFAAGLILTSANPLTILFWVGVFASKIYESGINKKEIVLFALGAVSTTLVPLGILSFAAGSLRPFLNSQVILVLNLLVGVAILIFAVKMFHSKKSDVISQMVKNDTWK